MNFRSFVLPLSLLAVVCVVVVCSFAFFGQDKPINHEAGSSSLSDPLTTHLYWFGPMQVTLLFDAVVRVAARLQLPVIDLRRVMTSTVTHPRNLDNIS